MYVPILILLICMRSSQALQCMTCDGASSHEQCDKKGELRECLGNENDRPAWWPSQCNPHYPNSVCRCCCDSDSCNVGPINCMTEIIKCLPDHIAPTNGYLNCTNANLVGSVCKFSCMKGFTALGKVASQCDEGGFWSSPPPVCDPIICLPAHTSLKEGLVNCSDDNNPGSLCRFSCNNGYELMGSPTSTCAYNDDEETAEWSQRAPTCKPITCPEQSSIRNGVVTCNRQYFYQSKCEFDCKTKEYIRHPQETGSNVCQVNGSWSHPKPCCIKPCPPHAVFDLVMALDSSSSVGQAGWNQTLNFVKSFTKLYDLSVLNFALFRYNSRIDSSSEIRFDSGFDPPRLLDEIGTIPYDGTGTNTGMALTYAKDVMLSMGRGRRKGAKAVVVVVTDGKAQDDVSLPAEGLRNAGIETFAVGVTPIDARLDFDELQIIAGDPSRVEIAEEGYIDLNEDFAKQLSKDVCGDPCSHPDVEDLDEN